MSRRILIASMGAYCIANITWWIQPELIHELIVSRSLSETQAGIVVAAEMAALAFASALIVHLFRDVSYLKIALIGVSIAIAGTIGSLNANTYSSLLLIRIITGLGEGAALMVASSALANFQDPDRAYGKINIVNIFVGAGLLLLMPVVASYVTGEIAFSALLVGLFVLTLFLLLMPASHNYMGPQHYGRPATPEGPVFFLTVAVFMIAVSSGAMWSFYFVLGIKAGFPAEKVHHIILIAVMTAVLGSGFATLLGATFGRFKPVLCGVTVMTAAIMALLNTSTPWIFQISACVNVASMYFLLPYFYGYAAAEDSSGRASAMIGGAFLLTGATGPYLGGIFLQYFTIIQVSITIVILNIGATGLFIRFERGLAARQAVRMQT